MKNMTSKNVQSKIQFSSVYSYILMSMILIFHYIIHNNDIKGNYIATDVPQPVNDFKYSDEKDINYANKVITWVHVVEPRSA